VADRVRQPVLYHISLACLCTIGRKALPRPSLTADPMARCSPRLDAQAVATIAVQNWLVGRCTMLTSAAFFVLKALVRPAAGPNAATAPRAPSRPAGDHDARDATRTYGHGPSTWKRMFGFSGVSAMVGPQLTCDRPRES
jgi:hypothetical protein